MTPATDNLSFYQDAEAFKRFHKYTSYYQRSQQYLAQLIQAQPTQLVMELGCAVGETSRTIARHYPQATIVGVDFRPEIIDEAQKESAGFSNLHFQAADMTDITNYIPWRERYPDVICSLYSFHHIPDPIENKFAFARQLYDLPVEHLRVVIVDVVTDIPDTDPAYPNSVMEQWCRIAQEAYRSVLLNRYIDLLSQGVPSAEAREQAEFYASYSRDVELAISPNVAQRNDEYPVTEQQMLEIWLEAGFSIQFHGRVNSAVDSIFVMTK
jgi:SAM-dependent methyltransferase